MKRLLLAVFAALTIALCTLAAAYSPAYASSPYSSSPTSVILTVIEPFTNYGGPVQRVDVGRTVTGGSVHLYVLELTSENGNAIPGSKIWLRSSKDSSYRAANFGTPLMSGNDTSGWFDVTIDQSVASLPHGTYTGFINLQQSMGNATVYLRIPFTVVIQPQNLLEVTPGGMAFNVLSPGSLIPGNPDHLIIRVVSAAPDWQVTLTVPPMASTDTGNTQRITHDRFSIRPYTQQPIRSLSSPTTVVFTKSEYIGPTRMDVWISTDIMVPAGQYTGSFIFTLEGR